MERKEDLTIKRITAIINSKINVKMDFIISFLPTITLLMFLIFNSIYGVISIRDIILSKWSIVVLIILIIYTVTCRNLLSKKRKLHSDLLLSIKNWIVIKKEVEIQRFIVSVEPDFHNSEFKKKWDKYIENKRYKLVYNIEAWDLENRYKSDEKLDPEDWNYTKSEAYYRKLTWKTISHLNIDGTKYFIWYKMYVYIDPLNPQNYYLDIAW